MVEVWYKPSAIRTIKKFTQDERQAFDQALVQLREGPEFGNFLKGSLRGFRKWRYHVSGVPYRIAYELERGRVTIIAAGKRKNFYDLLGK